MASPLPTPVNAALGIVPAVLDGVRNLPGKAVQFPVLAISNALATMDALRREYEDLAERGEGLVARLRGGATQVAGDVAENGRALGEQAEEVAGAGFAKAGDAAGTVLDRARRFTGSASEAAAATAEAVDDASEAAAAVAERAGQSVAGAAGSAGQAAAGAGGAVAGPAEQTGQVASGAAEQAGEGAGPAGPEDPKGVPTPKATEPDATRVDTAASPSVVQAVEDAVQQAASGSAALDHDALPLPDYDHMTLGSLRGRLRSLSVDQLVQIRTYEKAHANRLPVVTMLDNRIAKLATDPDATPSGPLSTAPAPEQQALTTPQPTLSPATTNAPPMNPPSQGDPTNPAQPR